MKKKNNLGFTLIELLVVIAIIGVLVTIVIVAINPVKLIHDSQDARMRADLNQIKASMQLYYNDCKFYPTAAQFAAISGTSWGDLDTGNNSCDSASTYMKQVPKDTTGTAYLYATTSATCNNTGDTCTDYVVGANLNTQTADDSKTVSKCSAPVPTGTHNYRVCND